MRPERGEGAVRVGTQRLGDASDGAVVFHRPAVGCGDEARMVAAPLARHDGGRRRARLGAGEHHQRKRGLGVLHIFPIHPQDSLPGS